MLDTGEVEDLNTTQGIGGVLTSCKKIKALQKYEVLNFVCIQGLNQTIKGRVYVCGIIVTCCDQRLI